MTNGSPAGSKDSPDVAGIVICQAMKIAGTHVGKIAVYE